MFLGDLSFPLSYGHRQTDGQINVRFKSIMIAESLASIKSNKVGELALSI